MMAQYREAVLWDLMIIDRIRTARNGLSDQESAQLLAVRQHLQECYLPVLEKLSAQKPPEPLKPSATP